MAEPCRVNDTSHQKKILFGLVKQQQDNTLCDVALQIGGRVYHAHRAVLAASSDYFRALFTTEMVEKSCSSITLDLNLTTEVTQELLYYIYTGEIHLNENNVNDIFVASDYLIISDLKEQASRFLQTILSPTNCLEIRDFAEKCACEDLEDAATACIRQHFLALSKSDEFKDLPFQVLEKLTSNDNIVVRGEEDIYEAILGWVHHDREKRMKHFEQLFRNIRVFSMSREFVRDHLEEEPLITGSLPCMALLVQGLNAFVFQDSDDTQQTMQPRNCLRKQVSAVLAVGGLSAGQLQKGVLAYLHENNRWLKVKDMTSEREEHAVVVLGDFLYAIGGSYNRGKSVERYDPRTNTWSAVNDLLERTCGPAAVAVNDKIYVLGGKDGFQAMSTVQCYDPNTNAWSLVRPMKHARKALCAAVVHGCIYAIGGCTFDNNSLTVVEKFTLETGEWTEVKPLNQQRKYACAEVLNNRIVVIGGYQGTSPSALQSCEVYSPEVDEWHPLADLSVPRAAAGVARLGRKIFVVGGRHNRKDVKSVEWYDQESEKWCVKEGEMPYGCAWLQCGVVDLPIGMTAIKEEEA